MGAFQVLKIAEIVATPSTLGLLLLLLGLGLQLTRFRRSGRAVVAAVGLAGVALVVFPVSQWLARPLEDRFPRPDWPACVDGIVVLSSGEQVGISRARNAPVYYTNEGAIVAAVQLLRRYPPARLVFSGGSGAAFGRGLPAASVAQAAFAALGIDPARISYEDRSRTTWENLRFTQQMVRPRPGEVWILVAAAMHMPRSMGVAQHIGWPMLAWPTDYRTLGEGEPFIRHLKFSRNLAELDEAAHEWLGLLAYRLDGRIDSLFPAPTGAPQGACGTPGTGAESR